MTAETRYMVSCVPWEEHKRLARKHGWDGKDDSAVSDYTEPDDGGEVHGPYTSLQRAFLRARQLLPIDTHGQVYIDLEVKGRYGWESVATWYIDHETKTVKVSNPDSRSEVDVDE